MVAPEGDAFSYERGTPVSLQKRMISQICAMGEEDDVCSRVGYAAFTSRVLPALLTPMMLQLYVILSARRRHDGAKEKAKHHAFSLLKGSWKAERLSKLHLADLRYGRRRRRVPARGLRVLQISRPSGPARPQPLVQPKIASSLCDLTTR